MFFEVVQLWNAFGTRFNVGLPCPTYFHKNLFAKSPLFLNLFF